MNCPFSYERLFVTILSSHESDTEIWIVMSKLQRGLLKDRNWSNLAKTAINGQNRQKSTRKGQKGPKPMKPLNSQNINLAISGQFWSFSASQLQTICVKLTYCNLDKDLPGNLLTLI